MSTRLALPAALLALLAVLFLVFQGGPDGGSGGDDEGTGGTTQEPVAGDRPDQATGGDDRGPDRTELEATTPPVGADDPEAAATLHAFTGFVVDLEGRPLAGATVRALGFTRWGDRDDSRALVDWDTETAADGSFRLPATPRDNLYFTLEVRAADHAPRELRNQRASPGRTRDLGEIRLDRGFTLSGQVVDPRGLPVAEARVQAYRDPQHPRGAEALLGLPPLEGFEAVTDREGNFTIALLPQGAIRLRAEAEGYFESWSGIASAIPDTEAAGMVIHLREGARVFGVVLDQGRHPVAGARVQVESRGSALDDTYRVETESAADGRFTLTVPGAFDRITLTAASDGFFVERRRLRESQVPEPQELLLTPAPQLSGVVVDGAGRAVPGATVRLVEQGENRLDPRTMAANDEATSAEDGSFTLQPKLRSAWGGRFTVYAWQEDFATGQSEMFRLRESSNFRMPDLRLVLEEGFSVAAEVRTAAGEPAAGSRVVLRKLRYQRQGRLGSTDPAQARGGDIFATASTDAAGMVRFPGLGTGDWRLEAHLPGHSPVQSEDFSLIDADFETTLSLQALAGISGQVVGDLGAFQRLRVTANAPGQETRDAMVDADGRFEIPGMMPATWSLALREADPGGGEGFLYGNGTPLARADGIEVVAGRTEEVRLELELDARGSVVGKVRVNGEAAVGYQVFLQPQVGAVGGDPRQAARQLQASMRSAEVDFAGGFRMAGLESGDYWLVAMPKGQWPQGMWENEGDGPRGLQRRSLSLRDSGEKQVDFDILLGSIELKVLNRDGRSTRVSLVPTPDDGRAEQGTYLNRNGTTLRDIPAGSYLLRIPLGGGQWDERTVSVPAGGVGQAELSLPARGAREGGPKNR